MIFKAYASAASSLLTSRPSSAALLSILGSSFFSSAVLVFLSCKCLVSSVSCCTPTEMAARQGLRGPRHSPTVSLLQYFECLSRISSEE
ncbi:hypothetical protein ACQKWADRAFT_294615 [Trichoderma austrokoningii]